MAELEDDTVPLLDVESAHALRAEDVMVVVMSPRFTASYRLAGRGDFTIGRANHVEIRVDDPSVSRRHAVLSVSPRFEIRDIGSHNGTRVGGIRIPVGATHPLTLGAAITVGSATVLVQRASGLAIQPRRVWAADEFEARLYEECARANRAHGNLTVAWICVDRLALDVGVRQVLAGAVRTSDVLGEYAFSEYAVLFTDSRADEIQPVLSRITTQLEERGVKATCRTAQLPDDGTDSQTLIAAARIAGQAASSTDGPVVADARMHEVYRFVKLLAAGNLGVLVLGETGVGKEVVAEQIHRLSPRAASPFLRLNCAALSESLLESELFGHEKGAFTNALSAKPGLLETATGGTVFLDEIGELPINLQVKLLRVIEEKHVLRVGGVKPRPLDVRFVAATNRDLEQEAQRGAFREDLYYRLAGATVAIPPLRERIADIEPLARMFLDNASAQLGHTHRLAIAPATLAALEAHHWPGNIRELRNAIERAALICGAGPVEPHHLPLLGARRTEDAPAAAATAAAAAAAATSSASTDDDKLVAALEACGGNQSRAAKLLGISRSALIRRLEKLGTVVRPRKV